MPTEAQKVLSHKSDDAYRRAMARERQRDLDDGRIPDLYLKLARGHIHNLLTQNKVPTKRAVAEFLREYGCDRDKIGRILSQLKLDKPLQGEMFTL